MKATVLGPLFYYDLLCTLRRGRFIAVRCVYALALLIALFCLYASWFGIGSFGEPLSPNQEAAFATDFFFTFLAVQLVAVLLLTPAYTSVAVAEEREAGRLDFLLTSELSNREIVLGKFAARLTGVALILLTGLPILGLMQFLGGVDPALVLAGFAATIATMCSVGSFGVWVSIFCEKTTSALWQTYIVVSLMLLTCWCLPGANYGHPLASYQQLHRALDANEDLADALPMVLGWYLGIHGTLTMFFLGTAIPLLRPRIEGPLGSPAISGRLPLPPPQQSYNCPRRPPINEAPLLWKELHLCAYRLTADLKDLLLACSFLTLPYICLGLTVAIYEGLQEPSYWHEFAHGLAKFGGITLASLLLLCIGLRASASVKREREQGTLDSLLTLPVDRRDILWAKWLGSILSVRVWIVVLVVIWLVSTVTGGLHQLSGPFLVIAFFVLTGCTASLGLCCSVINTNRRSATLFTLLALLLWNGIPWLLPTEFLPLSPVVGLREFTVPPSDLLDANGDSGVSVAWMGVLFSVVAGKIFWGLANYYFEAESGPRPV